MRIEDLPELVVNQVNEHTMSRTEMTVQMEEFRQLIGTLRLDNAKLRDCFLKVREEVKNVKDITHGHASDSTVHESLAGLNLDIEGFK